jgi:hypothetical protein
MFLATTFENLRHGEENTVESLVYRKRLEYEVISHIW